VIKKVKNDLNYILDRIDKMPLEEQSYIIEILKNRNKEKRREEILKYARQTLLEHRNGFTKRGGVEELLKDMEND